MFVHYRQAFTVGALIGQQIADNERFFSSVVSKSGTSKRYLSHIIDGVYDAAFRDVCV
jgi:hypothetical protein